MSARAIEFPVAGLSDGVVRLRLMADTDVPAVVEALQDPEIPRWTVVPSAYEEKDAHQWMRASVAGLAAGTDLTALVVDAADDRLLGAAALHAISPASGRCSAGYWLAADARGRGVATRALRVLCRFAFEELGVHRVELWIDPENAPSLAVAERAGFAREGLLRSFRPVGENQAPQRRRTSASPFGLRDREPRDMLMYSLLPQDVH